MTNLIAIIEFLETHWGLIAFLVSEIGVAWVIARAMFEGIKCSLRNDILEIYDKCVENGNKITRYQHQSIRYSYEVYKKLKGNSFVDEIVERINSFEFLD